MCVFSVCPLECLMLLQSNSVQLLAVQVSCQTKPFVIYPTYTSLPCVGVTDYSPTTTSVTFTSVTGTMLCGTFTLTEDLILEGAETFVVTITDSGGAIVGSLSSATVTINDNDGQYTLSYN